MAFAIKYKAEFEEENGSPPGTTYTPTQWRVDILEDGFIGNITTLTLNGESPLNITWEDIELYSSWVMPSEAIINLVSSNTLQFTEFVTADEDEYRVDIYKDGSLYWQGFVVPGDYEEDYSINTGFDVRIRAVDGLNKLDNIRFPLSGTVSSLINILSDIFSQTYLSLEILENVNMYEESQTTGGANSPFLQTTINKGDFKDGDYWTYGKALNEICKTFQCVVYQSEAKWVICRIPLNNGGTFTQRTFNSSGVYQSNAVFNPVIESNTIGENQVRIMTQLTLLSPVKETFVIGNTGLCRDNFCDDGYFNYWESATQLSRWTSTTATYSRISMYRGYGLNFTNSTGEISSIPKQVAKDMEFRLVFKYLNTSTGARTYRIILEKEGEFTKYWNGSSWTITASNLSYSSTSDQLNQYIQKNILITATPHDGYISIVYFANSNASIAQIALQQTTNLQYGEDEVRFYSQTANNNRNKKEEELNISDKGDFAFSNYGDIEGSYASVRVRVNFATIVDGDQFKLDIREITRTFQYRSSVPLPTTFVNITELVALIKGYYTGEEYTCYYSLVSGSTYDVYVIANYRNEETIRTSYNFNYTETDSSGSITNISEVNDISAGTVYSTKRQLLISGEIARWWSDGTSTGGILDMFQKTIHNQFSSVIQRHRGRIFDQSKSITPQSVIHDSINNNGKYFMFNGGQLDAVRMEWNGTWTQIITTIKSFTKTVEEI